MFYDRVRAVAARYGVTRLADITGLDRLALPVWQAVRPAGFALSVHQGKGATPIQARIGALCEAIESHCAENAPSDGPSCALEALPDDPAGVVLSDYSRSRALPLPTEPVQWCSATDFLTGRSVHLPHEVVSLDYRIHGASYFDRSSNGLAVGATEADAAAVSLLELIERDALGEWQRCSGPARRKRELDPDTIPFDWFHQWRTRFERLDIELRVYGLPSLLRIPVFACWITGGEEFGKVRRSFSGAAAYGSAERALFKALAEAIQSRLTHIAGVRDDILPSRYAQMGAQPPLAVPATPLGMKRRAWRYSQPQAWTAGRLAEGLAGAGYRRIAIKRLDAGFDGLAVTKAFVPGLGAWQRCRRAPA